MSDYVLQMVCDNDRTLLAETVPMTAKEMYDRWTTLVLSAGFNTPRCPTCKHSTFSDLNISTKSRIKRLDTGGLVKFETIKREAKAAPTASPQQPKPLEEK